MGYIHHEIQKDGFNQCNDYCHLYWFSLNVLRVCVPSVCFTSWMWWKQEEVPMSKCLTSENKSSKYVFIEGIHSIYTCLTICLGLYNVQWWIYTNLENSLFIRKYTKHHNAIKLTWYLTLRHLSQLYMTREVVLGKCKFSDFFKSFIYVLD